MNSLAQYSTSLEYQIFLGCINDIMGMFFGNRYYSKQQWKEIVWKRAWEIERQDWIIRSSLIKSTKTINSVSDNGRLLIWWQLAGIAPKIVRQCEVMAKILCNASYLKVDCYQFRRDPVRRTYCELCNDFSIEDARHIILHCLALEGTRNELFNGITQIEEMYNVTIFHALSDVLATILGLNIANPDVEIYIKFLKLVADCVYRMYNYKLKGRNGIG